MFPSRKKGTLDIEGKGNYKSVDGNEKEPDRIQKIDSVEDPDTIIKDGNGVQVTAENYGKLTRTNLWAKMPASTYGICIHSCLSDNDEDFAHDISVLIVPMLVTVTLQACILWKLYGNLLISKDYTCQNSAPLVCVSYFLLLNNACQSIGNVLLEFYAIKNCKHFVVNSELKIYKVKRSWNKFFIAYFTIICEIAVTLATCMIGIWYINVQAGVRLIVLSSVSVLFITNIDDVIFSNMLPAAYKSEVDDYSFDIRDFPSDDKAIVRDVLHTGPTNEGKEKLKHKNVIRFQLYYQTLFYIFVTILVVYSVRYYTCGYDSNFLMGTDDMPPSAVEEENHMMRSLGFA